MSSGIPAVQLGSTGPEISRVGLGAWLMGGSDWEYGLGPQDDGDSVKTILRAVEAGCNWIDTAPAYGFGHSERVVGRAIASLGPTERPYVFTKCAIAWDEHQNQSRVWAPAALKRDAEESLERLGVDRIDLFQIHWPGEDEATVEDAWGGMAELVDEGKTRWIGVSNFDVDLLDRCEAIRHVDSIQPPLSLIIRSAAEDVIPWAAAHGTGVIVYSPLQSGILSGRFSREWLASLDETDARRHLLPEFQEPALPRNLELVARIDQLAQRLSCSTAELAIAWTLAVRGVTAAIVGARRPDQIDGWSGAGAVELDDAALDEIAGILAETGAGSGPARF